MWVVLGFCLLKAHVQVRVVKWKRENRDEAGCVKDGIPIIGIRPTFLQYLSLFVVLSLRNAKTNASSDLSIP